MELPPCDLLSRRSAQPYQHDDTAYQKRIFLTLKNYKRDAMNKLSYKRRSLAMCTVDHKKKLLQLGYGEYLENVGNCIQYNQSVLNDILNFSEDNLDDDVTVEGKEDVSKEPTYEQDFLRLQEMFAQIVREWSSQGAMEREQCFGLITLELQERFPEESTRKDVTVLIPGCGLGRFAFELANLGFRCKANEQSLPMLFTANFILNKCERKDNYRFYPWIYDFTNRLSSADITTPVSFPDVDPMARCNEFSLEVLPGEFVEVCQQPEMMASVNVVVTSFFIDSAHNVLDYVKTIKDTLTTDGVWINMGPLSYSYERFPAELSIELTWDVLREAIVELGFKFLKEETDVVCTYAANAAHSMADNCYKCIYFVCQKL